MHVVKLLPHATMFLSDYGHQEDVKEWISTLFDAIYMEPDGDLSEKLKDMFSYEIKQYLTYMSY